MIKFWQVNNTSDAEAELILYGTIADERPWWDSEKTMEMIVPLEFIEDMRLLSTKSKIIVRLNSPGGDVFAAHAIYTNLKTTKARKEIIVDGVAASAATIIMMAGDVVKAPSNALIMIHNPAVFAYDYMTEKDLSLLQDALKTIKDSILEAYMQKATVTREDLSTMMDNTKWMTGSEAKDIGFVDKVLFEQASISASADRRFLFANNAKFDIGGYKNKPDVQILESGKEDDSTMEITNAAQLEEQYPALVAEVRNSAVEQERQRHKDIDAISAQMPAEMVNEAKYTKPIAASELAVNALKANAALGAAYMNSAKQDAEESGAEGVGGTPESPDDGKSAKNKTPGGIFRNLVAGLDRSQRPEQ